MKTLVFHRLPNGEHYALVRIPGNGYKVIVNKRTYREGRRWYNVMPNRKMTHADKHELATKGMWLDAAIALFERKTGTKIEKVENNDD
jgi:hypothetical protein